MKKSISQFVDDISEKTLFIYCNDCYAGNQIKSSDLVRVSTIFATRISRNDMLCLEQLRYSIEVENVKTIVISSHYDCALISYVKDGDTRPYCPSEDRNDGNSREQCCVSPKAAIALQKQVMKRYLMDQIEVLARIDFFKEKLKEGTLKLKGVLIDDTHDAVTNMVEAVIEI